MKQKRICFSCIEHDEAKNWIDVQNKKNILLFGIEAHVCVLQTAIDLKELGYYPVVVTDCTGARDITNKEVAITRMIQEGIRVTTYESILFELCKVAGNEQFKEISRLVK